MNHIRREMTTRRRLEALMKRERRLAERIEVARAAGADPAYLAAECSALHWALAELERLHPEPARLARQDLIRHEERRAERRAALDGRGAP